MTDKPTETDAPALAGSEAKKGGSELNALLNEFDTPTTGKSEKEPIAVSRVLAEIKPVVDYVKSDLEAKQRAEVQETIKSAVEFVKEGLEGIPDKVIRGWLYERADNAQAFRDAFANRQANPAAWKAALAEARKDASTEFKAEEPTKRVASDINAARASISGATETKDAKPGPSSADKWNMSGREWEAYKAARYA